MLTLRAVAATGEALLAAGAPGPSPAVDARLAAAARAAIALGGSVAIGAVMALVWAYARRGGVPVGLTLFVPLMLVVADVVPHGLGRRRRRARPRARRLAPARFSRAAVQHARHRLELRPARRRSGAARHDGDARPLLRARDEAAAGAAGHAPGRAAPPRARRRRVRRIRRARHRRGSRRGDCRRDGG